MDLIEEYFHILYPNYTPITIEHRGDCFIFVYKIIDNANYKGEIDIHISEYYEWVADRRDDIIDDLL